MTGRAAALRTAFWHFRTGGLPQLREWRLRQKSEQGIFIPQNIKGAEGGWAGSGRSRSLRYAPYDMPGRRPRRNELKVGVILDDFSRTAFSYEWNILELKRRDWRGQLGQQAVDFVFIESAWNGNSGSWKHQLTGPQGPSEDLVELLTWCNRHGIPTVFWNKEDPPHFKDFLPAAKLFDVVFTSDVDRIPDYVRELGHDRVAALPFAAQPAVHNPVRPRQGWHSRGVAFAGMYFAHKYPERRAQMQMLLGAASAEADAGGADLEIYSRQLGGDENYQFPAPLDKHVVGSLQYPEMLTAYRAHKVFLNVNSVTESPSMCARRIFEISASGTPVVTTPSAAIPNFFADDEVLTAASSAEARNVLKMLTSSADFNERVVHKAQRRIWNEHTYAHRAESVVRAVAPEKSAPVKLPSVSALISTIRPHQLEQVFQTVGSQQGVQLELILLTHGFEVAEARLAELARVHGVRQYTALSASAELTLGECLNLCVKNSSGSVLTKMDDDDYYAPHYLLDLLHALEYSGADVVGKQSHYMHFTNSRITVLRAGHMEHKFGRMVMGPTITARREIFEAHPFQPRNRGEDTAFLASVAEANRSIYSADRFNYCQMRSGAGHTWTVADDELAASGNIQIFGNPREHIAS